jgi:hypothetical protein
LEHEADFLSKLTTLDAYQVTFFRSLLAGFTVAILTRKQGLRINAFGNTQRRYLCHALFLFVWATKKTTAANAIFLQYSADLHPDPLAVRDRRKIPLARSGHGDLLHRRNELVLSSASWRSATYQGNIAALFSGVFLGLYIMLLKHPRATGRANAEARNAECGIVDAAFFSRRMNSDTLRAPTRQIPHSAFRVPHREVRIRIEAPRRKLRSLSLRNFLARILCELRRLSASTMTSSTWFGSLISRHRSDRDRIRLFIKGVTGGTRPLDASIIGFIEPLLNPVWVFIFVGERPSQWAVLVEPLLSRPC